MLVWKQTSVLLKPVGSFSSEDMLTPQQLWIWQWHNEAPHVGMIKAKTQLVPQNKNVKQKTWQGLNFHVSSSVGAECGLSYLYALD